MSSRFLTTLRRACDGASELDAEEIEEQDNGYLDGAEGALGEGTAGEDDGGFAE